jgi:hypothetical protein
MIIKTKQRKWYLFSWLLQTLKSVEGKEEKHRIVSGNPPKRLLVYKISRQLGWYKA